MEKDEKKQFNGAMNMKWQEPPVDLLDKIIFKISREKQWRAARIRLVCFIGLAVISFISFIPAWRELELEVNQSGFFQFIFLIISDFNLVVLYWRDFILAIAEILPIFGLTVFLASLFALLFSLKFIMQDMYMAFNRSNFKIFNI